MGRSRIKVDGVRIDSKFMCPVFMDGHQMLSVTFSYARTIERQKNGTWKAEALAWGLSVIERGPLEAEWALQAAVKAAANERLDPKPRTPETP